MHLHVFSGGLLGISADFADHYHRFGMGIAVEQFKSIHKIRADDRIAANSDRRRLPNSSHRELIYRLIGQCPRPRNNSDWALLVNTPRHDPDLAVPWRNNSRTVGPNQPRAPVLQELPGANHVQCGNPLGDADDQLEFRIRGFHDRVCGIGRRNKNQGRVRSGLVDGFKHAVEDRPALVACAAFARRDSTHDLRSILSTGFGVERAFASCQTLNDDARRFIYKNAHDVGLCSSGCGDYFLRCVFHGVSHNEIQP